MGVGAIFVSTLAVLELPTPHDPPQSQAELLAATLQTIVSSVVLGSIVIRMSSCRCLHRFKSLFVMITDGLSITVLSLGTSVCSRTLTLTRSWTAPNGSKTPEWLVFVRRVPIGSVRRGPLTINDRDVERDADTKSDHPSTPRPRLVCEVTEIDRHLPALGLTTMARGAIPVPLDCDGGQTHDFHGSSHLPLESDTSEVRSFQ